VAGIFVAKREKIERAIELCISEAEALNRENRAARRIATDYAEAGITTPCEILDTIVVTKQSLEAARVRLESLKSDYVRMIESIKIDGASD
jgi:hypothetical protein